MPFRVVDYSFQKLGRIWFVKNYLLSNKVHFESIKFKKIDKKLSCPQMDVFVGLFVKVLFLVLNVIRIFTFIQMDSFLRIFIYQLLILYESNSHQKESITTESSRVRREKFSFVNEFFKNQHQIVQLWINLQILFYQ